MDKRAQARQRYIESSIGQRELAEEMGIPLRNLQRWSAKEDWPELRRQHGVKMASIVAKATEKAIGTAEVKRQAKALADYLEQSLKALDFGMGLVLKALRDPDLKFNDLAQGINSLTKVVQTQTNIAEVMGSGQDSEGYPDDLRDFLKAGGSEQPAPVFTAPGPDENPREP